jgi:hypothetical protein
MIRKTLLVSLLSLTSSFAAWGADPQADRKTEAKVAERQDLLLEVEQRQTAVDGLQVEQACPSFTMWDRAPTTGWNTLELGLSFPLGETGQTVKPYTRYTCRGPGAR